MQNRRPNPLFVSNTQKPKYAQIQDSILKSIKDGTWSPGDQIPPERKLAQLHDASVGTVRHAVKTLVDQGYLSRSQGRGTFVNDSVAQTDSLRYYRLSKGFGGEISALVIKSLRKPQKGIFPEVADKMGLDRKQAFFKYDRIFLLASEPVVYVTSYLPADLFEGFDRLAIQVLDELPLYLIVEQKYSMPSLETKEGFSAVLADSRIAEMLKIAEGSPVLRMEMLVATNRNVYYEYRESYCITSERQLIRD